MTNSEMAQSAEAMIAAAMQRRTAQGLRVVVVHEGGEFTAYAKDAAQAQKWRADARRKGWLVIE